ncbi:exodeoxyribonuclease VII small subunit [Desulfovibrio ferrophilus]|uniref:Exodeoxyribonuclease 7 small subunit n=1 Tax=Desulfovibrio ferrophilus TaxID=241368 RepID=A0A2Z6AVS5_9BACT|nr:exodeoxyribonuclease VII small subunit [Desulfovibrio ferrophilus]BBD07275.1 exodeoxyribonuclease VII small subunit [Desulfovibrio ferrophilus]
MAKKKQDFETRLARLQKIVESLEAGELALEDGVTLFKEGVELAGSCREQLEKARNEVKLLTDGKLKDFRTEEDDV